MGIIVEVISRSHKVLERHKLEGDYISLGRAYDNDVILTEPHISPHHAVIEQMENGQWMIADTASKNGLYTQKHKRIHGPYVIHSGEIFTLGKLQIRIFSSDHPVMDTVPLNPAENIILQLGRPVTAILILMVSVLLFVFLNYLGYYREFEIKPIMNEAIVFTLVCVGWAAVWAFTGRLLKHDARFFAQLTITALYLIFETMLQESVDILEFNSASELLGVSVYAVIDWLLLTTLLWFNLYMATALDRRQRWQTSAGVALGVIALSLFFEYFQENNFSFKPDYVNTLQPPVFHFTRPVSGERFLHDSSEVFIQDNVQ